MPFSQELLQANARYAEAFALGELEAPPRRQIAVLTCMDARLDPARFLGLREGDAHVIRNAGGRVDRDALRSLVISQQLLGTTEVVVIHHTECGMLNLRNEELRTSLSERLGVAVDAIDVDFLPFDDLVQSVRDDVAAIRSSPLIPDEVEVSGFIYDVRSGRLQPVEPND